MAKTKLLLYLKPEALEVYFEHSDPARLDFPKFIINHQEVFDEEKYSQLLEEFLASLEVEESEAVILVSAPLIYSKEFLYEQLASDVDSDKPLLDYNLLNNRIEEFTDLVPIDNNQISRIEIKGENSSLLMVTNKLLYQKIVDAILKIGGKVTSIVPITVFGDLGQSEELADSEVGQILADKKILQSNNFLLGSNPIVSEKVDIPIEETEQEDEGSGLRSKFLIIFGIIFILAGLVVLALMMGLLKNPFEKPKITLSPIQAPVTSKIAVSTASSSAVLVGSSSAALQEVKKENITIGITNGSGVVGQGGKVQTALTNLGYSEITIIGTNLSHISETTIDFKNNINSVIRDEITKELQKTFLEVKSNEASAGANYDVNILTGPYK